MERTPKCLKRLGRAEMSPNINTLTGFGTEGSEGAAAPPTLRAWGIMPPATLTEDAL